MLVLRLAVLASALLGPAAAPAARAAHWIAPDWPAGGEPRFAPVAWLWLAEVRECPLLYRAEVDVPAGCDRATVALRTSGYVYVYVDGRQAYEWAPRPRTKEREAVPADPAKVHEVDLSDALRPGRRVLAVSAPARGFVLDGGLYAGPKRLASLQTGAAWTVTKFPPTTCLDDQPLMRVGHKGDAAPVKPGEAWTADEDALARAAWAAAGRRLRAALDDAVWELELLTQKGIYLAGDEARGWGGPARLDRVLAAAAARDRPSPPASARAAGGPSAGASAGGSPSAGGRAGGGPSASAPAGGPPVPAHAAGSPLAAAAGLLGVARQEAAAVGRLEASPPAGAADLAKRWPDVFEAAQRVASLQRTLDGLARRAAEAEETVALALAATAVAGSPPAAPAADAAALPAARRARLEQALGHPLNRLNESRYDRLGWIEHPGLTDSDLGQWGIRINPVAGPTKVAAPRRWLFSTDPADKGLEELRHTIGYNIENQWPTLDAGRPWNQDPRFATYAGAAWYRARLHVPGEWAGSPVVLTVPAGGRLRLWINDAEVTDRGTGQATRVYPLPPGVVAYGGENVLALRVEAGADVKDRGLTGPVSAACPALEGAAAGAAPRVDVLATPLAPCVVLAPRTETLDIHHGGRATLLLPPGREAPAYDRARDGDLKANWVLWRPAGDAARPVLLIFEKPPSRLACEDGVTRLALAGPGARLIAVRPWVKAPPPKDPAAVAAAVGFWSRAALAVPVHYMSVTRVLKAGEPYDDLSIDNVPRGPVLHHTVVYDYLETKDAWGTEPMKVAPLPALASLALDTKFRGLAVDGAGKVGTLQDGGLLAPYRAVAGADRVAYAYPVEPFPRLAGFTSWLFAGGDAGVTGNRREVEAMASTGANSFRPQHNWSDQPPPKGMFPPNDPRTRVQVLADFCQAGGMNYMNNIDETLGQKAEVVTGDYAAFMEQVNRHYEKVARQLADRPFWAVAYDLINEAFHHKHQAYNPAIRALVARVRAIDRRHLCYVEPCESWGAIQQLALIEPTGDPLTLHSFHDYNFRLHKPSDRWPTLERDLSNLYRAWLPVFVFAVRHGTGMHCGEFGGFARPTNDSRAQTVLLNDFFRVFDQFGMHHHYYSGREIFESPITGRADGALRATNVVRAYRAYFRRPDFNAYYRPWPGHPRPPAPEADR